MVIDFIVDKFNLKWFHYHPERFATCWKITQQFFILKLSNKARVIKIVILELRHRDKTRKSWLKQIMKVRPQDPSCVADSAVLATQLGTPRGRYDEHSGKFPSVWNQGLIEPVGERTNFRSLMQAGLATVMSTHAFVLVDSVGPPSAEVCRTATSFP
jgi:hypothetical protein